MEEAEEAGAVEVNDDDHPLPFWIFLFVLNLYDRVNAKRLGHCWQHVLVVMGINMQFGTSRVLLELDDIEV